MQYEELPKILQGDTALSMLGRPVQPDIHRKCCQMCSGSLKTHSKNSWERRKILVGWLQFNS